MKAEQISILLPVHNGARHLRHTLQSVLAQTDPDWELIVVDDASTDDTAAILRELQDTRIRLLSNPRNEHICHSLNIALAAAQGRWIARIDADDFWYPEKLSLQRAYLEAHEDCGACFTYVDVVDEQDRPLGENESWFVRHFHVENQPTPEAWQKLLLTEGCRLCHPSVLLRREAMGEGYDPALVQVQDFELWLRVARRWRLHVLPTVLMAYRASEDSVSARSAAVDRRSDYEMGLMIARYVDEMPPECFREVFGLRVPEAANRLDFACEKAFALLERTIRAPFYRSRALDRFAALLHTPEGMARLREMYGFRPVDFYRLSSEDAANGEQWLTAVEALPAHVLIKASAKKLLRKLGLLQSAKKLIRGSGQ